MFFFIIWLMFSVLLCSCTNDYFLNTENCKIPNLDLFDDETRPIFNPEHYLFCNHTELLTYVEKNGNNAVLHLREDVLAKYPQNTSCCYSYVTREGTLEEPDVGINISACEKITNGLVKLTNHIVKVVCSFSDLNSSYVLYENVHNPVIIKESVMEKTITHSMSEKPFSVLLIVIDSISRINFMRAMSDSYDFLKENNFIAMKGYTKVGDNTFPNCMSLLTGFDLNDTLKKCNPTVVGKLDSCPMIWYDYRKKGYITAYAEDDTPIGTFNYLKKGFKEEPTDYYFKPYLEATETLDVKFHNYMPYCTGPETAGERILNLAKDFSVTFKNYSTFGVFWMNTFSHNEVNAPYVMDTKLKNFFQALKNEGILNESIVILLSDHGIRFGDIRKTKSGWFEERMPLNMISVPEKFKQKFPRRYVNLKGNSNKLTSTYDMYMTLQDILKLSGISGERGSSTACPQCISVFEKIPENRSCAEAGVPPEWCVCEGRLQSIDINDEYVRNATRLALRIINKANAKYIGCSHISLNNVLSASISEEPLSNETTRNFFVVFETNPAAIYLTTIKFHKYISKRSKFYIRRIDNANFCVQQLNILSDLLY